MNKYIVYIAEFESLDTFIYRVLICLCGALLPSVWCGYPGKGLPNGQNLPEGVQIGHEKSVDALKTEIAEDIEKINALKVT